MTRLALDLAAGADAARAEAALGAADTGPVRRFGDRLAAGPDGAEATLVYVVATPSGALRSDSIRAILATGLVPRRLDPAQAAAMLWCGAPLDALVEGVERRASNSPTGHANGEVCVGPTPTIDVRPIPLLMDGTAAARALAAHRTDDQRSAVTSGQLRVRWGPPSPHDSDERSAASLDPRSVDIGVTFDRLLDVADAPTVDGLEAMLLSIAVEHGGHVRAMWAKGGDAVLGVEPPTESALRAPWRRLVRRRFRPADDALDVTAARRAELLGLERAPRHRVSSAHALLPAQTRDALSTLGPRAVPRRRSRDESLPSLEAGIASLGLDLLPPLAPNLVLPFVDGGVAAGARSLPMERLPRPGDGRWAAGASSRAPRGRSEAGSRFDAFLDDACRGALAARLARLFEVAARQPAFRAPALTEVLARFRAGTSGWTGRRILTVAFLAAAIERDRLELVDPR